MKIEDALKRYAELKISTSAAETEMEELKPLIKEHIMKEKVDKLPTSVGTFSLGERSTWKYSPAVEKLQDEEKAKGVAKKVTTTSLLFKPPKE